MVLRLHYDLEPVCRQNENQVYMQTTHRSTHNFLSKEIKIYGVVCFVYDIKKTSISLAALSIRIHKYSSL